MFLSASALRCQSTSPVALPACRRINRTQTAKRTDQKPTSPPAPLLTTKTVVRRGEQSVLYFSPLLNGNASLERSRRIAFPFRRGAGGEAKQLRLKTKKSACICENLRPILLKENAHGSR